MVQDVAVVVYDEGVAVDAQLKRRSGLKTAVSVPWHAMYIHTHPLSTSSLGERQPYYLPGTAIFKAWRILLCIV